jgi:hypothetical protein
MFMNATRRASARATTGAPRAVLLAFALAASAGGALAGFVDNRPAPAPVAPAPAKADAAGEGVVATPVSGGSSAQPSSGQTSGKRLIPGSFTKGAACAEAGALARSATDGPESLVVCSAGAWTLLNTSAMTSSEPVAPPAAQHFTISRSDRTIREALVTWSKRAGWTHDPEHWTVPFDLPVLSSADLGTDFKGAVRALLSSTDLTNMPLQPCFYSNNVLRVVPKAELCDRMAN